MQFSIEFGYNNLWDVDSHIHIANVGIGAVNQNTVFYDGTGSQADQGWFFDGIIDEAWVVN